jgi:hypothetical protein
VSRNWVRDYQAGKLRDPDEPEDEQAPDDGVQVEDWPKREVKRIERRSSKPPKGRR